MIDLRDLTTEFDYEEPLEKRFEELSQELCIEDAIREEAWEKYKDVRANFSIDGDQIHWLVCALYECCRRSISDTLSGHMVENAYVSLSRLLSAAKMSMVQFFHRIRKWADMTDMTDDMRDRFELLQRQFAVSSVIFRNFGRSFGVLFRDEQNRLHPTGADLFRLTWLLFIKSRANFPAVTDDLVNSYHLLASCLDWMLGATMLSHRADLINQQLSGLPKEFLAAASQRKSWCPPHNHPPCMLRLICEDNGVNYVECKTVKEHFFRPFVARLMDKELIKIHVPILGSLLEPVNFDTTLQNLNNSYEEYLIGTGDFDERIYLGTNASEEIGSTGESGIYSNLGLSSDIAPSTRRHVLEWNSSGFGGFTETTRRCDSNAGSVSRLNGGINFNNPEARDQNLHHLQILLSGHSKEVSESLSKLIESHCSVPPLSTMQDILNTLATEFQRAYIGLCDSVTDSTADGHNPNTLALSAAQQRLHLCQTLYHLVLENVLVDEIHKIEKRFSAPASVDGLDVSSSLPTRRVKPDLTNLLSQSNFLRSLFACCMEFVLISCDPPDRHFPWILDALSLDALHFLKVIEVIIRSVNFPRDVVKYMNQVAELILDSYAWRSRSSLWSILKASGRALSVEEVISPRKLERSPCSNGLQSSLLATNTRKISTLNSGLVFKHGPSPMKQPRLLSSSGVLSTGSLFRTRSNETSSGGLSRHSLLGTGSVDDESAQAAAQLLASGAEGAGSSSEANLNAPTDEVGLTSGTDEHRNALESVSTGVAADGGQSLWSAATNALLNYYPVRHDSLAIFFRQFYTVASFRLRDLCERLNVQRNVLSKAWTCLEQVVVHETDLLRDRCLDQIILCCLYGISRLVLYRPLTFVDILQAYRMQSQSHRGVYRHVLITHVTYGRSSSEERSGIASFYNTVFLPRTKDLIRRIASIDRTSGSSAAGCSDWMGPTTVTPILAHPGASKSSEAGTNPINTVGVGTAAPVCTEATQSRRITGNRNVFISPVKQQVNLSPKRVIFTVGRSTGKELQDVNLMISSAERRASMANLTMGLKRPMGSTTGTYVTTSSGFNVTPSTGASRSVTLVGPAGYGTKQIDFDL